MKIMHIIPTLASGGAERMLSKLVNNDKESEHIIITLYDLPRHYDLSNKVTLIELSQKKTILGIMKMIFLIYKNIRKIKPDIIQSWMAANYFGPILKLRYTNKIFITNYRAGINKRKMKLIWKLHKIYLNTLDFHIFVSESARQEYAENGISFNNTIVITNGFSVEAHREKVELKDNVFGYVGRYDAIKNQDYLINEFNRFCRNKNVKLVLAGKGLCEEKFQHLIDEDNISKFIFLGEMKNVESLYKQIKMLILVSKNEGFPNVVGEAMSYGVPVATTDAGESFAIIRDSGIKLTGTENNLCHELEKIYNGEINLKEKSLKAKKIIEECYSVSKIIKQYTDLYTHTFEKKVRRVKNNDSC